MDGDSRWGGDKKQKPGFEEGKNALKKNPRGRGLEVRRDNALETTTWEGTGQA